MQARVIHNSNIGKFDKPRYHISLNVESFYILLTEKQFHDAIKLVEYFTKYSKFILKREQKKKFLAFSPEERTGRNLWQFAIGCVIKTLRAKKNRWLDFFALPKEQREANRLFFKEVHKALKKGEEVDQSRLKRYDKIIYVSKMQDLFDWNSQVQAEIEVETKKAAEKSWFRMLSFSKKQEIELDITVSTEESLPNSYVWLEFEFYLDSGNFVLSKYKSGDEGQSESVTLFYHRLKLNTNLRVLGMDVALSIQDLSITYSDKATNTILLSKQVKNFTDLLYIAYSSKPINSSATARLALSSQAVDVSLDARAINSILSFFLVLNVQDTVKTAAWDKFQEVQDATHETLNDLFYKQSSFEISINAYGPTIRLPSRDGVFVLSLGVFLIDSEDIHNDYYEKFNVAINNLELSYEKNNETYSIVPSFGVKFNLMYLKSSVPDLPAQLPIELGLSVEELMEQRFKIVLIGEIPKVLLKFSPSLYHQVLNLDKILDLELDLSSRIHVDKKEIIKNCKLITRIRKQGSGIQSWTQYIAILSGAYIYFFKNEKETISASEFYIKDCSITPVANIPNTFSLQNRFGECIMSFPKERDYQKWVQSLTEQIAKLRTNKSMAKSKEVKNIDKKLLAAYVKIPVISVKLCNEEGFAISETIIESLSVQGYARPYDILVSGKIESLLIKDLQRQNSSSHFSSFAKSVNEGLINLEAKFTSSDSPLYNDQDLSLDIQFGKAQINWNPDIISSTLSFFTFAEYSDPNFKKPVTVGMIYPNHTLVSIHIKMDSIDVYFNNVQKEISLAVVSMTQADLFFIIKNGAYVFKGDIGNLKLNDLTNYPRTALNEPIRPFTLFSVKEDSQALLRFKFYIYTNDNPEKPKDTGSVVELELNSVSIVYVHQPFMRILDYVSYKVIGVFDAQSRVRDINYWSPIYKLSYLLNMSTIQSLNNDEDLMQDSKSFTAIKICMKNPMVTLLPRPYYPEYFVVDLGDIKIINSQGAETQGQHEIWLDIYTIEMQQVNIVTEGSEVAEPFDMLLKVERPVLSLSQQSIQEIDKKYKIGAKCSSFRLKFSHAEYRLVLKTMDMNFTYDDQLENYINPESVPFVYHPSPDNGGIFFKLQMEVDLLSVLLTHEDQEIAELVAINSSFAMIKFNDYASEIDFKCLHFVGLVSEDMIIQANSSEVLKDSKIEDRFSYMIFEIPTNSVIHSYKKLFRLVKVLFCPLPEADKSDDSMIGFTFNIKTEWDGEKNMIVKLEQVRINFHWTVIQMIQNFFYYGFPDYTIEKETPYDYMNRFKPSSDFVDKEILSQYFPPKLMVSLCVVNPIMLLPTSVSNRVVVAQTSVNFVYMREKESEEYSDSESAGIMRFILHQLELYTCRYEELISKSSFLTVQKRSILEPVQVFYECIYLRLGKFSYQYKIKYEIGKMAFIVSHRDILLLSSVHNMQKSMLNHNFSLINSLTVYPKERESKLISLELSSESNYGMHGINVLIINDSLGAYSPILDINCIPEKLNIIDSKSLWKLSCFLGIRANYYNPQIDVWEPFIEFFTFNIDVYNNANTNPENQIIGILDEKLPFNINFTEAMITHFQVVSENWKKTTLREINEKVSPISISNQTGYKLKAARITANHEVKDEIYIPSLKTVNFEIDSTEIRALDFSKEHLRISIEDFSDIENISMNKLACFTKEVAENVFVIVEVNFCDTTKVLQIRSEFTVVNQTDYTFALKFANEYEVTETMCKIGMEMPVPIKYTRKMISLKPLQYVDKSWIDFDLLEYSTKQSGECTEIRIDDFYFLLVMIRDPLVPKKVTLYLKAPIIITNYLPCEMALQIFYDTQAIREINLQPNERYKEYSTSVNSNLQCSLKLPNFNFSERYNILLRKKDPPKYITVRDSNDDPLNVYIYYKLESSHMYNFYAPIVFINNTSIPLTFYYKKTSTKKAAGQDYDQPIVPIHSTKKARVSMGKIKSKSFKIGAVGVKNVIQFLGDINSQGFQMRYQFLYEILLARVITDELLFTKVLIISPRYLIMNTMQDEDLILKQYDSESDEILIARSSKEPFHWPDAYADDLLILKPGCLNWEWSGAFSIMKIGTFVVQCRREGTEEDYRLIKVEIKLENSTTYVLFSEEHEKYSSFRIQNYSDIFSLIVFQDGYRVQSRKLKSQSWKSFTWCQPLMEHQLIVLFYSNTDNPQLDEKPDFKFKFSLDEMNIAYKIPTNQAVDEFVYGRTYHQGSTKILEFTDTPISKERKMEKILNQYHFTIHKFGISIIEQSKEDTCEILYWSFSNITVLKQTTKVQNKTEVFVKSFQIDNQFTFNAIYPVMLYPEDATRDVITFMALSLVDENPNCVHFEKVSLNILPLVLNLESCIVRKVLEMFGRVAQHNSPVYDSMKVYKSHKSPTWTRKEANSTDMRYYIACMEIQPIKLILSFVPLKEASSGSDSFNKVARALGMAITAIDSVPVKLYSAVMIDVFGTSSQNLSTIWMHYRAQLASEIFTLIGHAEILGNPIGLLNNLGTGVVDFFKKPAQGIMSGPIGAGKGLLKGTGSLLRNTVQGTFGTVSKLANSLATGITLTQDREFLSSRQREKMNKPKNVVDGVGMGFKVFFSNLGKGLAGVITEPIKGYKKKKIKGALSGGARGLSGLIIKPIAGVLDAAGKAAEGIKNTTDVFIKKAVYSRSRVPRPFYGAKSSIKSYNEYDAQVIFFMNQLKKGLFLKEKFVAQLVGKDIRGEKLVNTIYLKKIVLADIRTKQLLWIIDVSTILSCEVIDKGVVIGTTPSQYKLTKKRETFIVPFPADDIKQHVFKKIREVLPLGINIVY